MPVFHVLAVCEVIRKERKQGMPGTVDKTVRKRNAKDGQERQVAPAHKVP